MSEDRSEREPGSFDGHMLASSLTMAVFAFAGALIMAALIFYVPRFKDIFAQLNVALPLPTKLALLASELCVRFWFAILPLAALATAAPIAILRRRAWAIYVPATLLALLLAFGGFVSIYLPIVKIQQMLMKER